MHKRVDVLLSAHYAQSDLAHQHDRFRRRCGVYADLAGYRRGAKQVPQGEGREFFAFGQSLGQIQRAFLYAAGVIPFLQLGICRLRVLVRQQHGTICSGAA